MFRADVGQFQSSLYFPLFINLSLLLVSDTVYTRLSLKLELGNTSSNMKKSLKVKLLECEKYQQNFDSV